MPKILRFSAFLFVVVGLHAVPSVRAQVQTPEPADARESAYVRIRAGLPNARLKFAQGGPRRVVFFGGSITEMKGWRELIGAELQRRFPRAKFDFINAGIGSTGSVPGAFRFARDALSRGPVDLLFVDAAVNDETNGTPAEDQIRGMEGIVRHARLAHPEIDIVLLHFADPAKLRTIGRGEVPAVIRNHEKVAERYALPTVNVVREVAERIQAGEFTWEGDFKGVHPAPFGQQVYANSITRLFDAVWGSPAATDEKVFRHPLPEPIDRASFHAGRLGEVQSAQFDDHWTLHEKWRPEDATRSRAQFRDIPVLSTTAGGARLRYAFKGTAIGLFVLSGPDAGKIEWRVDGGKFQTVDLHTRWSKSVHLPWVVMLDGQLAEGAHELELRVLAAEKTNSGRQAVRIAYFLVNEP